MNFSIKKQLLIWLLVPLMTLALISTLAAYAAGIHLARQIYDAELINSADSVVARIRHKGDKIIMDLPPAAQAILRHNYNDEFYYQVLSSDGKFIAGDRALPPPAGTNLTEPQFRTLNMNGKEIRILTLPVHRHEYTDEALIVQAAETRNTRQNLAKQITFAIMLAQGLVIACAILAIWFGIDRGLLPLKRIEEAVLSRQPGDLRPLNVETPSEISNLIRALNQLLIQLNEDIDLQKRFLANAAHQLRTPLAVLGTYNDLARKIVKENEAQEVLSQVDGSIKRMSNMVNKLLTLARSEPTALQSHSKTTIDLCTVAANAAADSVPEALAKNIDLEFQPTPDAALIYGDAASLHELVMNLLQNAISYSPSNTDIVLRVYTESEFCVLMVQDEGPGIPEPERGRVFERFYRISGTEQPGTGLGLAIVREIALVHDARVEITDAPSGQGACIRVFFKKLEEAPLSKSPVVLTKDAPVNARERTQSTSRRTR